jgi:T-complex protein 1 subunit zeta
VEIMHMQHRSAGESQFVNGLVLDHGGRHPDMPKLLENGAAFPSPLKLAVRLS